MYFLAHKLASLCRWRFAGAFVSASALERGLLRHMNLHRERRNINAIAGPI
jgi:hypothetical protein